MMKLGKMLAVGALVLALALAWAGQAWAAAPAKTVIANTFTLASGETLDEDLNILAGTVTLEKGSTVNGHINLTGGTLDVGGLVDGSITATGGSLSLKKTAHVTGSISLTSVAFSRADGAQVDGEVQRLDHNFQDLPVLWGNGLSPLWAAVWFLARVFIFSALAVLLTMFFPRQAERTSRALVAQPLVSGGLGLLTILVAPFVVLLLSITIILIPVAALATLILGLVLLFGWIALGVETGRRLAQALHQDWATPLSAGLGTLLLTFVLFSVNFIPCVGWIFPFAAGMVGLGAALLTVVGTRDFPDASFSAAFAGSPVTPTAGPASVVDASVAAEPPPPPTEPSQPPEPPSDPAI